MNTLRTIVVIALRNLVANKKRSGLLGAAIALVTTLLVVLASVSNGMQETMLTVATTMASGHVNVAGFYKVTLDDVAPLITDYPELVDVVQAEQGRLGVDAFVVRGRGFGKLVTEFGSQTSVIAGIDIASEHGLRETVTPVAGSLDDLARDGTMLLFESQAKRLGVKVGDAVTIAAATSSGVQNTVDAEVAAIARDMGMMSSFNAFLHHRTLQELYLLKPRNTGAIHLFLADAERADAVADALRSTLRARGYEVMEPAERPFWMKMQDVEREDWTGQRIDVTTWTDEMQFMRNVLRTFDLVTSVLVSILLVIVVLGVMNTLWMAIRERTQEVGTMRAIGMPQRAVLAMFMIEAFVLSVSATLLGALLAAGVAAMVDAAGIPLNESVRMFLMSENLRLIVDLPTALTAIVTIATVTTLGALFPAWRAARLPPVTAMQHA
jgi:ABC-type lipoprotein release transport system permease subunit